MSRLYGQTPVVHLPSPPKELGRITFSEFYSILYQLHIGGHLGVMDEEYKLTSVEEYERLLKWYQSNHPYTKYWNCDTFAWMMRAKMLEWCNGEFPCGWIWASSTDKNYPFGPHGFNWVLDYQKKLYICDDLEVAAPKDKCWEFYPVKNVDMLV